MIGIEFEVGIEFEIGIYIEFEIGIVIEIVIGIGIVFDKEIDCENEIMVWVLGLWLGNT
jgi:hypothetical protein